MENVTSVKIVSASMANEFFTITIENYMLTFLIHTIASGVIDVNPFVVTIPLLQGVWTVDEMNKTTSGL